MVSDKAVIDRDYLANEFRHYEDEIMNAAKAGDYIKAVSLIKFISMLYYRIAWTYRSDKIEDAIQLLSAKLFDDISVSKAKNNTVVFYDGFGVENAVLTDIYIDAMASMNMDIYWITYEWFPDVEALKNKYPYIKFILIPRKNILDRMLVLKNYLLEVNPQYVFIETEPNDVEAAIIFDALSGTKKFFIDLTDHSFWIGTRCADYYIGFRDLGCNVLHQLRGVPEDKIRRLPFYPSSREKYEYKGMPFGNKKYVFSGGEAYKIEGSTCYEEIVEHIMETHPNVCFVYACRHPNAKLNLLQNQYKDRFFCIAKRNDLDEIMKHSLFYLQTFPIGGGLMTLYALKNNRIPLQLMDEDPLAGRGGYIKDIKDLCFVKQSMKEIFVEIDRLIDDDDYRAKIQEGLDKHLYSREEFLEGFKMLFCNKLENSYIKEKIEMNYIQKYLYSRFTYDEYCEYIINTQNKWVQEEHPEIVKKVRKK